jgi:hypothetical protein
VQSLSVIFVPFPESKSHPCKGSLKTFGFMVASDSNSHVPTKTIAVAKAVIPSVAAIRRGLWNSHKVIHSYPLPSARRS